MTMSCIGTIKGFTAFHIFLPIYQVPTDKRLFHWFLESPSNILREKIDQPYLTITRVKNHGSVPRIFHLSFHFICKYIPLFYDILYKNFQIQSIPFQITFPSGAFITFNVRNWWNWLWANIQVQVPSDDYNNCTTGLCGKFDGDSANDLTARDGSIYNRPRYSYLAPENFTESWK